MQRNLNPGQKCLLTLFGTLAAILLVWATLHFNNLSGVQMREINNNPDKFHLVATNSAYDYGFIYDPLAADQWRLKAGGLPLPFGFRALRPGDLPLPTKTGHFGDSK
jgi:hypothetical protein